jgi:hypothetical protein
MEQVSKIQYTSDMIRVDRCSKADLIRLLAMLGRRQNLPLILCRESFLTQHYINWLTEHPPI